MSYILDISSKVPQHRFSQDEFGYFYKNLTKDPVIQRQAQFIGKRSKINTRYSVLDNLEDLVSADTESRLQLYKENAPKLALDCISELSLWSEYRNKITDIITVSCTGMYAPGLEFDLINALELPIDIKRSNIHFMGCYAGITALRLASDICKSPNRNVLIISVELCTLHFQKSFIPDYLYSNYLFADGAAAVLMSSEKKNAKLKVADSVSRYAKGTEDQMSWNISNEGFLMGLSQDIPKHIKSILSTKLYPNEQNGNISWAVHPGGVQIVKAAAEVLELSYQDLKHSYEVLREYGNMSSPTILFILERFLKEEDHQDKISACAFGPGLTLESVLLEYV